MSSLFQIVSGVLRIAVILGIAGVLVHATVYMGHLALDSSQQGLVSISKLNHALLNAKKIRINEQTYRSGRGPVPN